MLSILDDKGEVLSKDITSNYVNEFFPTIGGRPAANVDMLPSQEKQFIEDRSPNYLNLPELKIDTAPTLTFT